MGLHETDYVRTQTAPPWPMWEASPVHIGARASALADPSEMLVSSTVKDLVAGSDWHLYRVAG